MLVHGLVAGWRLDEPEGNPRKDVLGSRTLLENISSIGMREGKIGGAALFTLTGSRMLTNTDGEILPRNAFTLSCWVNILATSTSTCTLLQQRGTVGRQNIVLNCNTRIVSYSINATLFAEGPAIPIGIWTQLALTYDESGPFFTTYQNGQIITQRINQTPTYSSPNGVSIGIIVVNPASVLIDESYMWGRCLNHAEIKQLYNVGNAGISYPWTDGKSY